MANLPRDVLKWLQTLDLSMTFLKPRQYVMKRVSYFEFDHETSDFANGYLIAEIFSCYYPGEFNVNLFSNGLSLESKLDNWGRLEKFFKKKGMRIPRAAIDAVINGQFGAANLFLQNIYVLLTNRPLKIQMPSDQLPAIPTFGAFDPTDETIPRFTLPTTSRLIKTIPDSEMIITKDIHETKRKIRSVIAWQKEAMKVTRKKEAVPHGPHEMNKVTIYKSPQSVELV